MSDAPQWSTEPLAREYGPLRKAWNEAVRQVWHFRLKRWLPRLVWIDDEVDVVVTFPENPLRPVATDDPSTALHQLTTGPIRQIENLLAEVGIEFDTGMGCGGRDWEWDWSLRGPIHVKFRRRAKRPERRG